MREIARKHRKRFAKFFAPSARRSERLEHSCRIVSGKKLNDFNAVDRR